MADERSLADLENFVATPDLPQSACYLHDLVCHLTAAVSAQVKSTTEASACADLLCAADSLHSDLERMGTFALQCARLHKSESLADELLWAAMRLFLSLVDKKRGFLNGAHGQEWSDLLLPKWATDPSVRVWWILCLESVPVSTVWPISTDTTFIALQGVQDVLDTLMWGDDGDRWQRCCRLAPRCRGLKGLVVSSAITLLLRVGLLLLPKNAAWLDDECWAQGFAAWYRSEDDHRPHWACRRDLFKESVGSVGSACMVLVPGLLRQLVVALATCSTDTLKAMFTCTSESPADLVLDEHEYGWAIHGSGLIMTLYITATMLKFIGGEDKEGQGHWRAACKLAGRVACRCIRDSGILHAKVRLLSKPTLAKNSWIVATLAMDKAVRAHPEHALDTEHGILDSLCTLGRLASFGVDGMFLASHSFSRTRAVRVAVELDSASHALDIIKFGLYKTGVTTQSPDFLGDTDLADLVTLLPHDFTVASLDLQMYENENTFLAWNCVHPAMHSEMHWQLWRSPFGRFVHQLDTVVDAVHVRVRGFFQTRHATRSACLFSRTHCFQVFFVFVFFFKKMHCRFARVNGGRHCVPFGLKLWFVCWLQAHPHRVHYEGVWICIT
jgi:hypothetical protein